MSRRSSRDFGRFRSPGASLGNPCKVFKSLSYLGSSMAKIPLSWAHPAVERRRIPRFRAPVGEAQRTKQVLSGHAGAPARSGAAGRPGRHGWPAGYGHTGALGRTRALGGRVPIHKDGKALDQELRAMPEHLPGQVRLASAWRPNVGFRCPHARHWNRFWGPATLRFLVDPKRLDSAVLNPSGSRTTSDLTVLGAWRP